MSLSGEALIDGSGAACSGSEDTGGGLIAGGVVSGGASSLGSDSMSASVGGLATDSADVAFFARRAPDGGERSQAKCPPTPCQPNMSRHKKSRTFAVFGSLSNCYILHCTVHDCMHAISTKVCLDGCN